MAMGSTPIPEQAAHEDQVPQRLGHLLAAVADQPRVHVHPGERAWSQCHPGVRGAHLVVRENQVRAARLDVEGVTQVFSRDRRALDVPAGPAAPEPRVPGRVAGPFRQPDQDVERILLARAVRVAATLRGEFGHLGQVVPAGRAGPGQRAEPGVRRLGEVDVLVHVVQGAPVGHPGAEPLDDGQRLDRPDQVGRRQDAQRLHVVAVALRLAAGQFPPVLAVPVGPFQQWVVDVGHVLHVDDGVPRRGRRSGGSGPALPGTASSQARTSRSQAV